MTHPIVGTDGNAPPHRAGCDKVATDNNFNVEWAHDSDSFNDNSQAVDADESPANWEQYSAFEEDSSYDSDEFDLDFYSYVFDFCSESCIFNIIAASAACCS